MSLKILSFWSFSLLLASIIFSPLSLAPCLAQNASDNNPKTLLDVEIYFLPEKIACRDDGYAVPPQKSNCQPWTVEELNRLPQKYKVEDKKHVPPLSIELSSKLYDLLIQYKNSNKTYAANRKSLLMLFTFYEPSNNYVTLERVVDNHLTKIPTYEPDQVIGYELVSNRFIHHERADAFIPGERIQWKLTEGRNVWVLSTSAPP